MSKTNKKPSKKVMKEIKNEVSSFLDKMDLINEWRNNELERRNKIAESSKGHENTVCPICGKVIPDREGCNGKPLVDACVCGDCDKRYVFPFRMITSTASMEDILMAAPSYYSLFMQGELNIVSTNMINSLIPNDSDVA